MKRNRIPIYLLILFLLIRLVFLFISGDMIQASPDYENRYRILAHNLLNGEEYGTGADLEYPPLFPVFLALNYTLFGDQLMSVRIFQIIFDLLTCVLLFLIANILLNRKTGYIAMILWGFYPMAIWQIAILGTESLFMVLIMLFMFLFILSYKKQSSIFAGFAGIMLGAAMLTRPILLYFIFFVFIVYWINIMDRITVLRLFSVFLVTFFITLSPWVIRNYYKYNEIVTGTKFPDGKGSVRLFYEGSDKDFVFAHNQYRYQISNMKRSNLYSNYLKPGVSKNKILFDAAIENISSKPLLYLKIVLYKIWKLFTFTVTGTYDKYIKIINIPIIFLSLFGLYSVRHQWREFLAIILIIIYILGIYTLLISMFRYLMPVFPFIILFAAIGIDRLFLITYRRKKIIYK